MNAQERVERGLPLVEPIEFEYKGDPTILQDFADHARLSELGQRDPNDHRRWIVFPGGGTRGALQSGLVKAAVDTGFFYGATGAVGLSVGSAVLVEGAAHNPDASRIFYEDNLMNRFVHFGLPNLLGRRIVNFSGLEKSFREGHPLDPQVLRACPFPVVVCVMPKNGEHAGEAQFIDVRHHPDPIGVMMASMNIPWVGDIKSTTVEHDGQTLECNDGGLPNPYAISYAIEHGAREILLMMNEKYDPTAFNRIFARVQYEVGKHDPDPVRRAVWKTSHISMNDMDQAHTGKIVLPSGEEVKIGIYAPTKNRVKFLERDWMLLRRAVYDSEDEGHKLFDGPMAQARESIPDVLPLAG